MKASYESIESSQELIGLRKTYLNNRNEEDKNQLLKKYTELKQNQVPGCFSPTFEDILFYGRDQGSIERDSKFVPRFLKGVYKHSFWSGSGNPNDAGYALFFNGYYGEVYYVEFSENRACGLGSQVLRSSSPLQLPQPL